MPLLLKILRYFFIGRAQRLFYAQLFTAALIFGVGWSVWSSFKSEICGGSAYRIEEKDVRVWNPPIWISDNFVREALDLRAPEERAKELNALDPDLVSNLASAFASHPWVKKVEKIDVRFPGRVDVWLQFKKPVAVVDPTVAFEVVSEDEIEFSISGTNGTNDAANAPRRGVEKYVVDADGYRLPDDYFRKNPSAYRDFLCILGIHSTPISRSGQCVDPLVVEAASFAEFLETFDVPKKANVDRVVATKKIGTSKGVYSLKTKNNTTIEWGYFAPPKSRAPKNLPYDSVVPVDEEAMKRNEKRILFDFQKKKLDRLEENVAPYSSVDEVPKEEGALLNVSETLENEDI